MAWLECDRSTYNYTRAKQGKQVSKAGGPRGVVFVFPGRGFFSRVFFWGCFLFVPSVRPFVRPYVRLHARPSGRSGGVLYVPVMRVCGFQPARLMFLLNLARLVFIVVKLARFLLLL